MGTQYEIRRMRLRDLDRILEIEAASFGREAYDRKLIAHYLRKCGELFLVASSKQTIHGYLLSCLSGNATGPSAELVSVAVDPAARGKGAASAMLESVLRRLRRRGAHRLHLVVRVGNTGALAFYQKFGFRRLRLVPQYYEDGADGIAMSRKVTLQ
jgi:ribosomal-protein-alanine N-acetyltransferase